MNLRLIFVLAACSLLTSCSIFRALFGGEDPSAVVTRIAEEANKIPPGPSPQPGGVDIIEMVVYALAALGLPSIARLVLALKPVLVLILRAILVKTAPDTTPAQPSTTPTPEAKP